MPKGGMERSGLIAKLCYLPGKLARGAEGERRGNCKTSNCKALRKSELAFAAWGQVLLLPLVDALLLL